MSPYYSSQVLNVSKYLHKYVRHTAGPICLLGDTANLLIILAGDFILNSKCQPWRFGH